MDDKTTSDYVFKAYIVNTAAYDAGDRESSGSWLYFPPYAEDINELFEKIGLPMDATPNMYFMDDYISNVEGLKPLLPMYEHIDELASLAEKLSHLSPEKKELLAAIQESPFRFTTLEQFKEFSYNTECFILEPGIKSLTDRGWEYLKEYLLTELTPELKEAINPIPFGRKAIEEDRGCITSRGYLTVSGDEWKHEPNCWQPDKREKKPSIKKQLEQSKKEHTISGKEAIKPQKAEPER